MKKAILLLTLSFWIISCEKESEVILTKGTWVLDDEFSKLKGSVKFNSDHTYIMRSKVLTKGRDTVSAIIYGEWLRTHNDIIFKYGIFENDTTWWKDSVAYIGSGVDRKWRIIKLTADMLTVDTDNQIHKFYNE